MEIDREGQGRQAYMPGKIFRVVRGECIHLQIKMQDRRQKESIGCAGEGGRGEGGRGEEGDKVAIHTWI